LRRAIHSDALEDIPRCALFRGAERLRMPGKRAVRCAGSATGWNKASVKM